jgi:pyruvyltransferase
MVTGSILNLIADKAIVWGSGIAESYAELPERDIRAVRGMLTLKRVQEKLNPKNEIAVGDPCLLLPLYYNPKFEKKHTIGVIPHYIDAYHLLSNLNKIEELEQNGIKLININNHIEKVVDDILSCETIISSSLHGIICADAYGIPSAHIKITEKIGGDGFKYIDWYSNFNNREYQCFDLSNPTIDKILLLSENSINWLSDIKIDIKKLYESCPFK